MQTGTEQLKAQQDIMFAKGFYRGAIDGIWGPKTIEAKQKWEVSGKFNPGIPNNGLPIPERGPFPAGVRRTRTGLLTCSEIELRPVKVETQSEKPVVKSADSSGRASNSGENAGFVAD